MAVIIFRTNINNVDTNNEKDVHTKTCGVNNGPHSFSLNCNKRRLRSMKTAARKRNNIRSNTAATQYQYTNCKWITIQIIQHISANINLYFKLPEKTNKYRPHLPSIRKRQRNEINKKQQPSKRQFESQLSKRQFESKIHTHSIWVNYQLLSTDRTTNLITYTAQKQENKMKCEELAETTISPIASRTRSRITTVPKKSRIENTDLTGKVDDTSTVQRSDRKKKLMSKLT